jgi:hypothetical protein
MGVSKMKHRLHFVVAANIFLKVVGTEGGLGFGLGFVIDPRMVSSVVYISSELAGVKEYSPPMLVELLLKAKATSGVLLLELE